MCLVEKRVGRAPRLEVTWTDRPSNGAEEKEYFRSLTMWPSTLHSLNGDPVVRTRQKILRVGYQ